MTRTSLLTLLLLFPLTSCTDGDGETAATTTDGDSQATANTSGDGDTETSAGETADSDTDATTGDSDGELILSDVTVNVTYAGEQTGTLSAAAVLNFPPQGPPLAAASDDMPTFPWSGTLNDLENGEYYIVAILDIGSDNPQSPGPEDLVSFTPMPITIDGADVVVDLELVDP